jgi:serine/threonine-protein kinase
LAQCFNLSGWYGYAAPGNGCAKARALASRAIEIDPNLAQAHTAMAWAVLYYDYDFVTAEAEYRRSIALDPSYAVAHSRLALRLVYGGRLEEAISESKLAISLDPHSVATSATLDYVYWLAGRFEQLLAHAKKSVDLNPDVPPAHWALGGAYQEAGNFEAAIAEFQAAANCAEGATIFVAMQAEACALAGRTKDALTLLQQLLAGSSQQYVTPYMIGRIYTALGLKNEALNWLEIAFEERAAWMVTLDRDPRLMALRAEPRFESLRRKMNFPT